ncbi:MAG: DUF1289 domain-containing protein [Burkholderiaceae bacterium]
MTSGPAASPEPVSPCISICELDPATGLCNGCQRTIDEIDAWGSLDRQARRQELKAVEQRRRAVFDPHPDAPGPSAAMKPRS